MGGTAHPSTNFVQNCLGRASLKRRGDAMSKRKDLRNGRESGAWKPHKWSVPKCQAFTGHVLTVFLMELEREMPRGEATQVFGEFLKERDRIANEQFSRRWAFSRGAA